jgi:hypothetical protein
MLALRSFFFPALEGKHTFKTIFFGWKNAACA